MKLLFYILATGCSFLEASSGFIESPNYPNSYPNHQDKTYNIEIENGEKIEITFESFDLESHRHCAWDWMKVVDIGQGETLLEKSCGSNIPAKIISTSNKVDVIFHSDYSVTRKGFKLSWRALDMTLDGSYACLTPPHNPKSVRGAHKDGIDLWDGGVVPYEMTSSFQDSDKKTFLKAIQEIEEESCLRFKPRTDETAYIRAARECDCTSGTCNGGGWVSGGLGKKSPSWLYIGKICLSPDKRENVALVIHEILHSLGVVHTQTRPDRNDYIVVNESNIQNTVTARYQYEICQACLTYNTPYNCMSVMHYRDYAFSNGNGPTMVKKESNTAKCDLNTYMTKLEDSDIELLNKMYKCKPGSLAVYSYPENRVLVKDTLVSTIPKLGKEWRVTLDFFPTTYNVAGWKNSITLTTRGDEVITFINYHPQCTSHGGIRDCMMVCFQELCTGYMKSSLPSINTWTSIQLDQELVNGQYINSISISGTKVPWAESNRGNTWKTGTSYPQPKPTEFSDVNVFASNPGNNAQPGSIRNLVVETKPEGE